MTMKEDLEEVNRILDSEDDLETGVRLVMDFLRDRGGPGGTLVPMPWELLQAVLVSLSTQLGQARQAAQQRCEEGMLEMEKCATSNERIAVCRELRASAHAARENGGQTGYFVHQALVGHAQLFEEGKHRGKTDPITPVDEEPF